MTWHPGPPPETLDGALVLVVLRPELFAPDNPRPWDEYYSGPVAARWWCHKGKTTFGQWRINPDDVVRYAEVPDDA